VMESMSINELKRALASRGVDYRDCLEKQDLLDRLVQDVRAEKEGSMADRLAESDGRSRIDSLTAPERRLVELFERCAPSVAFIQTVAIQDSSQLSLNVGQEMPAGTGSGFVWDDRGHVVTSFHVIRGAARAKVSLNRGAQAYDATLVGVEPEKDLAVLKVDAPQERLRPVSVGSSADLLVGQSVVAIGNPFGLDNTLTTGVVSALGREVMGIGGRPIVGLVQTDAAINPGNSGGPLLDSSGRLIGVNTAIYSPSGASAGIGFAIPVDTVRRTVNQIIRYGRAQRPSLGVHVADDQILHSVSRDLGMKQLEGVLVMRVKEGSPAAAAGLRGTARDRGGNVTLGDIIISVAGLQTRQVEDLLSAVEQRHVGELVDVVVLRNVGKSTHPERVLLRCQLVERQHMSALPPQRSRL